jgi:hypothetical protein
MRLLEGHAELVEASLPQRHSFTLAVEMLRQAQHDGLNAKANANFLFSGCQL